MKLNSPACVNSKITEVFRVKYSLILSKIGCSKSTFNTRHRKWFILHFDCSGEDKIIESKKLISFIPFLCRLTTISGLFIFRAKLKILLPKSVSDNHIEREFWLAITARCELPSRSLFGGEKANFLTRIEQMKLPWCKNVLNRKYQWQIKRQEYQCFSRDYFLFKGKDIS